MMLAKGVVVPQLERQDGRRTRRIAIIGMAVALCAVLGFTGWNLVGLGFGAVPGTVVTCPTADPVVVGAITVPAGPVAGYCQDRLVNAAHIMNAGRDLGIGTHTQTVGVMTALGESGLRVLDHGDAAGADSRGLFQQRDNGAWGTLADRMDPYVSAQNFFTKLTKVAGWKEMEPTLLAHAVQVNADPEHYAAYWARAEDIVAALAIPTAP
ncbi:MULTISPECIES: hypothetical protein [unclassified Cryobacterium]|uniref:hypothetical protein n=1 Tax=unclassified Cryobacterium TaxID=2649013 RepID=UPI002AB57E51|nr:MULTISPECIES: hypothetical protein [unclassified Cryobacterium]MDY7528814.1 hypothetical protein [Cryobacterium sp. 10C2]MDY7555445.1 hypothetical protein [Cryobacterium sp. 10C3]MEB0201009.1 hypothetical protein [Cryobacterium sp. 5I3]MEB0285215.1 hypothetical protein [Cryobacterium sp. 10S3]MEB0290846.1 hypothetical protein [Cryobacterium sp. 10C2]